MQTAEHLLQAMRKMGEKRIPLTRVYRSLYSEDLFLMAYSKIARNKGALTAGSNQETIDGTSLERIRHIIAQLRDERFHFRPARRIRIPKKQGGTRPLGLPNFSDKLVQEALRQLLEAYYEPRFKHSSHGFRPGRGCHTALADIHQRFVGTTWFIEGDIRGCFDTIDHTILLGILARDIQDGRLLHLIRQYLAAGYLEDWQYQRTYSGTPQGGILSPLLANIYLHELDTFIEGELIPQNMRGKKRSPNRAYQRLCYKLRQARKGGDRAVIGELEQQARRLPSQDTQDPTYRRLKYVRYADDFLLGFIGPKSEAESIKAALSEFLKEKLHLEMSASKTLITHARTDHARFLGYAVSVYQADSKLSHRRGTRVKTRGINGGVRLGIPFGRIDDMGKRYQQHGKPVDESKLIEHTDAHIISVYQQRFRGIAEYYKYAVDRCNLAKLKHVMEMALTKTLARKHKKSVSQVYRKYRGTRTVAGYTYKTLQVEVATPKGSRCLYWGAIPLRVVTPGTGTLEDRLALYLKVSILPTDLIQRIQAQQCELCGSQEDCEVHHVRKLADLQHRWRGRKERPAWVTHMIRLRRKTLVVCRPCHLGIHAGKATPKSRNASSGEPDESKGSRPVRRGVCGKVPDAG